MDGAVQLTPDSLPIRSMDSDICAMILNCMVPNSFPVTAPASSNLSNWQADFLGSLHDPEFGMHFKVESYPRILGIGLRPGAGKAGKTMFYFDDIEFYNKAKIFNVGDGADSMRLPRWIPRGGGFNGFEND